MQGVFEAMGEIVSAGYVKPGGSGTQFTAAQAQWSNNQDALLYPSGSWIENEMKDQTKSDFQMTGFPEMVLSTGSAMPYTAMHSTAGEPFVIPSQAKNVAGGKELLRTMLSKEAATNFAKEKLAPTIVKDTVPADGLRVDRTGVAEQDAHRRRDRRVHMGLRRPLRHQCRPARGLEQLPRRRRERVGT